MTRLPLSPDVGIPHRALCRHMGIFGATGTGKTTTLGAIAERAPCPVMILDVKGDLESLASVKPLLPAMRIDAMGPDLVARALDLSPAQSGALAVAMAWADDNGRTIATLADLRALLNAALSADLSARYGLVSAVSVSAVQRALLRLERGAPWAFTRQTHDARDTQGRTVYACGALAETPGLYGAFAAHVLDSLYRGLGEMGDVSAAGLMVLIDEAHLLFDGATPDIVRRLEQITRLIRSKGVGLIYVTQSPADLPPVISGQLGTRVQHALRGATPLQQKAMRAAAETMPGNVGADDIATLGTGEAFVSVPGPNGAPLPARRIKVMPGNVHLTTVGVSVPAVARTITVEPQAVDVPPVKRLRLWWLLVALVALLTAMISMVP